MASENITKAYRDWVDQYDLQKSVSGFQVAFTAGYEAASNIALVDATDAVAVPAGVNPEADAAYAERNKLVAALAKLYPSGIKRTKIEGWDPEWDNCVYIDLPTGQASWHYHDREADLFADLPEYQGEWDGHTTELKYQRLVAVRSMGEKS